jgi:cytidylate kinase
VIKIAIDGPAGAGKSTVAKRLAEALSFQYVDTGAMYRGAAYLLNNYKIDIKDLVKLLNKAVFDFIFVNNRLQLLIKFDDKEFLLGDELRTPQISALAGELSKYKEVREALVLKQREVSNRRSSVIEGRDIATVVAPDAKLKIYLTATIEERAKRRCNEWRKMGINVDYDGVLADIKERDEIDKSRKHSPLTKVEDAIEIDTTGLDIDMVVKRIIGLLNI